MPDIITEPTKTRRRGPTYSAADILAALKGTHGMVFIAAEKLGCDPSTIHRRANTNKAIRAAIESNRGKVLDVAELKLEQAIQAGEAWAIAFALKTIGRGRGYVEKQEISIVPPEQVDAAIEHELARLASSSKADDAGTIEVQVVTTAD